MHIGVPFWPDKCNDAECRIGFYVLPKLYTGVYFKEQTGPLFWRQFLCKKRLDHQYFFSAVMQDAIFIFLMQDAKCKKQQGLWKLNCLHKFTALTAITQRYGSIFFHQGVFISPFTASCGWYLQWAREHTGRRSQTIPIVFFNHS